MGDPTTVETVRVSTGTWTVRIADDKAHYQRFRIVAAFLPDGAARATRVITRDNLTADEVNGWSPVASWEQGLSAEHRHARWIRERTETQ